MIIQNSSKINLLASKSVYDLDAGNIYVDLSPSVFIGNGANEMSYAKLVVKDSGGVQIGSFNILPPFSSGFSMKIPKMSGQYKKGVYSVISTIYDGNSSYTDISKFNLCDIEAVDLDTSIDVKCNEAVVIASLNELPVYKDQIPTEYVEFWSILQPSIKKPVTSKFSPFEFPIVEGGNEIQLKVTATYVFENNVSVVKTFEKSEYKKIRCFIDLCLAYPLVHNLYIEADQKEGQGRDMLLNKATDAFRVMSMIRIGEESGCPVGDLYSELELILGTELKCGTGFNQVKQSALSSTYINGCNVVHRNEGDLDVFTIDNYNYVISASYEQSKGWVKCTETTTGCSKYIDFVLDWDKLSSALLERFEGEDNNRFLNIYNKELSNVNPNCIDNITDWRSTSFVGKFQKWLDAVCACCYYGGGFSLGLNCGAAVFNTNFILGIPSSGTVKIPINVIGGSDISVTVNGAGISGSKSQYVSDDNSDITVPVTYNGAGAGNDGIKILIPQTFTTDDFFDLVFYSENQPPIPVTINGSNLDIDNVYRDSRMLGRIVTIFYNGFNRFLKRVPSDLTFPVSEWDYVSADNNPCRQASVVVSWNGGGENCSICIPVTS